MTPRPQVESIGAGYRLPPPICRDCKWAVKWGFSYELGKCQHPDAVSKTNLVTGKAVRPYSSICRNFGPCGPSGKLFERRQSRVARFLTSLARAIVELVRVP